MKEVSKEKLVLHDKLQLLWKKRPACLPEVMEAAVTRGSDHMTHWWLRKSITQLMMALMASAMVTRLLESASTN